MRDFPVKKTSWWHLPHRFLLVWISVAIMVSGALQIRAAFMATQDPDRGAVNRIYEIVHHDEKVLLGAIHKIGRKPYAVDLDERKRPPRSERFVATSTFLRPNPRAPPHTPRAPPRLT